MLHVECDKRNPEPSIGRFQFGLTETGNLVERYFLLRISAYVQYVVIVLPSTIITYFRDKTEVLFPNFFD